MIFIFIIIIFSNLLLIILLKLFIFSHQIYPPVVSKCSLLDFIILFFFNAALILYINLWVIVHHVWLILHVLLTLLHLLLHGFRYLLRVITKTELVLIQIFHPTTILIELFWFHLMHWRVVFPLSDWMILMLNEIILYVFGNNLWDGADKLFFMLRVKSELEFLCILMIIFFGFYFARLEFVNFNFIRLKLQYPLHMWIFFKTRINFQKRLIWRFNRLDISFFNPTIIWCSIYNRGIIFSITIDGILISIIVLCLSIFMYFK